MSESLIALYRRKCLLVCVGELGLTLERRGGGSQGTVGAKTSVTVSVVSINVILSLAECQQQYAKLIIIMIQLKTCHIGFRESRQRQIWLLPSSNQNCK